MRSPVPCFLATYTLFLSAAPILFAQTVTTSAPSAIAAPAAPSIQVNLSTPQNTFRGFLQAFKVGDGAAIKKCMAFKDDKESETFDILLAPQISRTTLLRAAVAKFGNPAQELFLLQETEKELDEKIKLTDTLDLQTQGNTATLSPKFSPASQSASTPATTTSQPATAEAEDNETLQPITFLKVGNDWKIQASNFVHKIEPAELKSMRVVSAASAKLNNDLLLELNQGKIASAKDLDAKMQKGMEDIVGKTLLDPEGNETATQPATLPTTSPATLPATGR